MEHGSTTCLSKRCNITQQMKKNTNNFQWIRQNQVSESCFFRSESQVQNNETFRAQTHRMKGNPRNNLHDWWSTHWLLTHSEHLKGHMTAGSAILLDEFVPVELRFPCCFVGCNQETLCCHIICNLFWLCAESEHVWENGWKTFPQNTTTTKLLLEESYNCFYNQHRPAETTFHRALREVAQVCLTVTTVRMWRNGLGAQV